MDMNKFASRSIPGRRFWVRTVISGRAGLVGDTLGCPRMFGLHNFSAMPEICTPTANADSLRCALDLVGIYVASKSGGEGTRTSKLHVKSYLFPLNRSRQGGEPALILKSPLQLVGILLQLYGARLTPQAALPRSLPLACDVHGLGDGGSGCIFPCLRGCLSGTDGERKKRDICEQRKNGCENMAVQS
jgi:hypothetical protein